MLRIKRPAIIGLLLILLVFTGYLNYQFTQQALRKTSHDYQKFEANEKLNFQDSNQLAEGESEIELVDSITTNDNIAEVISASNETLREETGKEVANLNRNYFVEHRLSRDKLRANLIDRLATIINNEQTNDKMRTDAQQEVINIGKISESELRIEGLIKSKNFDEALVLLTDSDIKIIVAIDELSETEMVKILEIVRSETSFDMDDIKIIKKQ